MSGLLFCLASGAAFGAMAVFGKLAYDEGATVGTLLAVGFTLAALLFWVVGETLGGVQLLGGGLVVLAVLALNARRTILQEATA